MLTNKQLRDKTINPEIAEFTLEKIRERLEYADNIQSRLENRATVLLRILLSFALAILGAGLALAKLDSPSVELSAFLVVSLPLFIGTGCMIAALWDRTRGAMGSDVSWWLRDGVIDGNDEAFAYMKACLANDMQERVDTAYASNAKTVFWLRAGMFASMATPLVFLAVLAGGY